MKKIYFETSPIFSFWSCALNEHQISEVYQLAREISRRSEAQTAQVYNYQNGNLLIPEDERYARHQRQSDGPTM